VGLSAKIAALRSQGDLGANGGGFPLMLRIAGIEMARAVCVEMNPLTYLRLQVILTTNLGSSAVAINAAVCGMPQDSNILLKPSRGSKGESIYTGRVDSNMSHVSVRTTTLQALCDQYFNPLIPDTRPGPSSRYRRVPQQRANVA
jgi:hypothetical protein